MTFPPESGHGPLIVTNYQCIGHNFLHNTFFKSSFLNKLFSITNSFGLGLPQSLYKIHHLNHHHYNNNLNDWSSLHLYSRDKKRPENIWTYSFLGPFRTDLINLWKISTKNKLKTLVISEIIGLLTWWGLLIWLSSDFFLKLYLPTWYLGQVGGLC